jgi:CelD/BcsL family acetyltransferase involved in cellulose biosynthesis
MKRDIGNHALGMLNQGLTGSRQHPGANGCGDEAGPVRPLTVALMTTVAELAGLKADYDRLNRLAGNIFPFALHAWHITWCRHFLSTGGLIRDALRICVVRDGSGTCVAIVPLVLTRRVVGALEIGTIGLLGRDIGITEIRQPLVQPGFEAAAVRALQDTLATLGAWDWVEWSGCNEPFRDALSQAARLEWQQPALDHIVDLPATWELLRARLKRNIRSSLRRCYNSLNREGLKFELAVTSQRETIDEALRRFLVLHAKRAQKDGMVRHRNVFAGESAQRFLQDVCAQLAELDIVRVFELKIGAEVVASRIGFVVGDSLYLYYSGFDPAWARYSVMTTTVAEAIKYAIASGLRSVNLSPGTDVSKTRWGPRQLPIWQATQTADRWRSRAARCCFAYVRDTPQAPGWLSQLLSIAKRRWE